jgi:hypothetical protein
MFHPSLLINEELLIPAQLLGRATLGSYSLQASVFSAQFKGINYFIYKFLDVLDSAKK